MAHRVRESEIALRLYRHGYLIAIFLTNYRPQPNPVIGYLDGKIGYKTAIAQRMHDRTTGGGEFYTVIYDTTYILYDSHF